MTDLTPEELLTIEAVLPLAPPELTDEERELVAQPQVEQHD